MKGSTLKPLENKAHLPPLADRMRPTTLADFVGHAEIVGEGKLLRTLIDTDELTSIILWGPPGVGKTTLAHIIAHETAADFVSLSGVASGKADLLSVIHLAEKKAVEGQRTVLFIDEIHRWNKAQQDALLPFVEKGTVTLIGATTENPSFEIIGALLSRSRVFILKSLSSEHIVALLRRALRDTEKGLGNFNIKITGEVLELLAELSGGDGRQALNGLELAVKSKNKNLPLGGQVNSKITGTMAEIMISAADIKQALQKVHLVFDKNGEEFYNTISALHKSMRGSDANAALYWLARMLEGGADPLYIARRVLRFASEDIGMANAEALIQANAAYDAVHKLGMPECSVHLAQAVVYCAKSKKSNLLYVAYGRAAEDARRTSHLGVPLHLRNAPTSYMKDIGYGKGYKYNPDYVGPVEQDYVPDVLKGKKYL